MSGLMVNAIHVMQIIKVSLNWAQLKKNSLKEIWHSRRFSEIREKHIRNQRNSCYPCDRCPIGG